MDIKTKFSVGDVVFGVYWKSGSGHNVGPCGFCGGDLTVTGKNQQTIQCPECHGNNEQWVQKTKPTWLVEVAKINGINIKVSEHADVEWLRYFIVESTSYYTEDDLFALRSEADAEAKRRIEENGN